MQYASIIDFTLPSVMPELGRQSNQFLTIEKLDEDWKLSITDRKVQSLGEVTDLINYCWRNQTEVDREERFNANFQYINEKVYEVRQRDNIVVRFWKALTHQTSVRILHVDISMGRVLRHERSCLPALANTIGFLIQRSALPENHGFYLYGRVKAFGNAFYILGIIATFFRNIYNLYVDADKFRWSNRVVKWIDLTLAVIAAPLFVVINSIRSLAGAIIHPAIEFRSINNMRLQ